MTRSDIIKAIQANQERAVGLGFDWPTVDITEGETDELLAFLWEIEEYLEAN